jgi:hypothetical protein
MNTEHTKEPWFAHKQFTGSDYVVFISNGAGLFTSECHAVTVSNDAKIAGVCSKQQFEENEGKPWPAEANAERIVACVNALEGVQTEALVLLERHALRDVLFREGILPKNIGSNCSSNTTP